MFWMGGHSSSGGAVEWMRALIGGGESAGYDDLMGLLKEAAPGPTGILFFPYLSGSGAPYPNPAATASFTGLTARHGRGELLKAVLEGNAYQLELMRRTAESVCGQPIAGMRVVGGGTKNSVWLQIKADVSGIPLTVPSAAEATLLGAALTAGVAVSAYDSFQAAARAVLSSGHCTPEPFHMCAPNSESHTTYEPHRAHVPNTESHRTYEPHPERHRAYRRWFEEGFLAHLSEADRTAT